MRTIRDHVGSNPSREVRCERESAPNSPLDVDDCGIQTRADAHTGTLSPDTRCSEFIANVKGTDAGPMLLMLGGLRHTIGIDVQGTSDRFGVDLRHLMDHIHPEVGPVEVLGSGGR